MFGFVYLFCLVCFFLCNYFVSIIVCLNCASLFPSRCVVVCNYFVSIVVCLNLLIYLFLCIIFCVIILQHCWMFDVISFVKFFCKYCYKFDFVYLFCPVCFHVLKDFLVFDFSIYFTLLSGVFFCVIILLYCWVFDLVSFKNYFVTIVVSLTLYIYFILCFLLCNYVLVFDYCFNFVLLLAVFFCVIIL